MDTITGLPPRWTSPTARQISSLPRALPPGLSTLRMTAFTLGVLAASSGLHSGAAVQLWADLDSLVLRGSDVTRYQGRRVLLGWGVARMTRAEMFREPRGVAVEVRRRAPPAQDAPSMNGLCEGVIRQQNLPSILVGECISSLAS